MTRGFQRVISTSRGFIALTVLTIGVCLAQSGGTPSASPPGSPTALGLENKINKLEEQVASLDKKIQKPPKDGWDKLSTLSAFISGILVAVIGALVTVMYQRRDTRSREAQLARETAERQARSTKEDEDRKAALKLQELENRRAETQVTISQAQTVRELLPYLQSEDEKTKQASLTLITFLGNADLAAQLSSLYKTDFAPVLENIISMSVATSEVRRQAAVALGRLGSRQEAAAKLVELSNEEKIGTGEKLSIAKELEGLGAPEKAAKVMTNVAIKSRGEERTRAIEALKRLNGTDNAITELSEVASSQQSELENRLAAIQVLSQLDGTQQKTKEWIAILVELARASKTTGSDLGAITETFKVLGRTEEAGDVLWEIGADRQREITGRYAAIENLIRLGSEKYAREALEERKTMLRDMAPDPKVKPELRLVAVKEMLDSESTEDAARVLREIIASPQAGFFARSDAASVLEKIGLADEAKEVRKEAFRKSSLGSILSMFVPALKSRRAAGVGPSAHDSKAVKGTTRVRRKRSESSTEVRGDRTG